MMKKILVTGANGQLAMTIKKLYAENNEGIDFLFLSKTELDITSKKKVDEVFSSNSFDYCINCAAYTNVDQAEKTPEIAFKVNAEGVKKIALACKKNNTVLIHISTDYVFDGEKETAYTVTDQPNPINEYGKSKLLGEQYVQSILHNYYIIRTSWLYSREFGNNFYRTVIERVSQGKNLIVTNDQIGCPTDTISLSKFILELIFNCSKAYGILHYSDNKILTWFEFAKQILTEKGYRNRINLVKAGNYITFAKRPKNSVLQSIKPAI